MLPVMSKRGGGHAPAPPFKIGGGGVGYIAIVID